MIEQRPRQMLKWDLGVANVGIKGRRKPSYDAFKIHNHPSQSFPRTMPNRNLTTKNNLKRIQNN
jgi:hypothetical protein